MPNKRSKNTSRRKKAAERTILGKVYDLKVFKSVRKSERPDFLLRRAGSAPFGVEVTRLYDSESAARLDNIDGYSLELIDGGKYRHKDDVDVLPVHDITIEKEDGTVHAEMKAVMHQLPALPDYIRMIQARIEEKGESLSRSRRRLTHVNLIIEDNTGVLTAMPPEDFTAVLLTQELRKALAVTPFREVFFVTAVKQGRKVFFLLRMLLLVSDLYLFNDSRVAYAPREMEENSDDEELALFGSFMRSRGVPVMLATRAPDEGSQVVLGNSSVFVVNNGVTIRDYADRAHPPTWRPSDHDFGQEFLTFCERYDREHVFKSGIVFDVRKEKPGKRSAPHGKV